MGKSPIVLLIPRPLAGRRLYCFGTALRAGGALPLYPAGVTLYPGEGHAWRGSAPPNLPGGFAGHNVAVA
jgi:hypothetical protein